MNESTLAGIEQLRQVGVIPVVRTASRADAEWAIGVLREAGLRTFELTLTTPGAVDLLRELAVEPGLLVGAGTVLDGAAARQVLAAGARFVVSPVMSAGLPPLCAEAGVPCVLGALTPTEVVETLDLGASAVKVFPVSSVGGSAYIRALSEVFPRALLAPTGGIGVDQVASYLQAGAAFVGVGGKLVDRAAIAARDPAPLRAAAVEALAQVRAQGRSGAP